MIAFPMLLYESDCWSKRSGYMQALQRAEMRVIRFVKIG